MSKPTLIYIPGLDGTGRLLHRQPALYEDYHVLCEAFPQDRPATYEELAAAAAVHMEEASPDRPVVVLAESFGGAVALTLALTRPELIERLVLVNTFAYFPKRGVIGLAATLGRYFPDRPSPPWSRPLRAPFFFSPDIPLFEQTAWWERTGGVSARAYGWRLAMIRRVDLRPRLKEIALPTLVLVAPDDRVVPCRAGRELARLLPHSHLVERRVGHAALIHPRVDIHQLLADPSNWSTGMATESAKTVAGMKG
jgi:pimeloyl-ACP methyl ester carboxylesterase